MTGANRDLSFVGGLISVGVIGGAAIGYLQSMIGGPSGLLTFVIASAAGGLWAFFIGLKMRRAPSAGVDLIVKGVGVAFSLSGIGLFLYLLAATHNVFIPFSATLCAVVLWWRMVPKERRAIPIGVGSGILAFVGVVEGVAIRSWPMILIGLVCGIGIIVPFKERNRNHGTERAA
ncbi:MAG: hypothetical protein ACREQR_04095 [Candidatus Binataceae bacterium]